MKRIKDDTGMEKRERQRKMYAGANRVDKS